MHTAVRIPFCVFALVLASSAGLFVGCNKSQSNPPKQPAPDRQLLEKQRGELGAAFNRNDAKAWAAFYYDDAEFIKETGDVQKGQAAVETLFAKIFADNPGIRVTASRTNERFVTPEIVLEDGSWSFTNRKDGGAIQGRYTTVWVHRDGQWRLISHRDWVPLKADNK